MTVMSYIAGKYTPVEIAQHFPTEAAEAFVWCWLHVLLYFASKVWLCEGYLKKGIVSCDE